MLGNTVFRDREQLRDRNTGITHFKEFIRFFVAHTVPEVENIVDIDVLLSIAPLVDKHAVKVIAFYA